MKRTLSLLAVAALALWAAACSSPGKPSAAAAPPTPTPSIGRLNPYVVEETATYFIERLPKRDYIRVDERHIRHPLIPTLSLEFFKEDDDYYYVKTDKVIPEEEALKSQNQQREEAGKPPQETAGQRPNEPAPPRADYDSLTPSRVSMSFRFEEVQNSGLPDGGLWRASFAIADMNGDGIPDIVAPSARLSGDAKLHIWLGDGNGHFTPWKLRFIENGKENPEFSIDYGGVAIGDIDGDGNLDVVAASHRSGLFALFGDGKGTFVVSRNGFRGEDFSTQAVALADVNGDGKLDVIAARDQYGDTTKGWVNDQVQVYLYSRDRSFVRKIGGLLDGAFSNSITAWDFDGDGKKDILSGGLVFNTVLILFKNQGDGTFAYEPVPDPEAWSYHVALAPGTFGKDRAPAFADLFYKGAPDPELRTAGINVHVYRNGKWEKKRVWREKGSKSFLSTLALGDVDGDGLDDIVFPDTYRARLRIFLQQPDGSFREAEEKDEPKIGAVAQHVRLVDLNGDGRLDVVLSKTAVSNDPPNQGGWSVFLNKPIK